MNYEIFNQDCVTGMREHVGDDSVDLIFTDPPYGIRGEALDTHYNRDDSKVIPGYVDVPIDTYGDWCQQWIKECERVLRPGGSIYIVSGYTNLHHILNALHATGLEEINHIIAQYSFGVYTKRKWVSSHYHVLFWSKKETSRMKRTFNTHCRFADTADSYNDRLSVQPLPREYRFGEIRNNNQLSEAFIEKFIDYSSNVGDLVLDPFGGSFSTARAALGSGRRFVGFELNSHAYTHFGSTLIAWENTKEIG
jgi:site-specific DNA-methyltransferase (adenine-specific)